MSKKRKQRNSDKNVVASSRTLARRNNGAEGRGERFHQSCVRELRNEGHSGMLREGLKSNNKQGRGPFYTPLCDHGRMSSMVRLGAIVCGKRLERGIGLCHRELVDAGGRVWITIPGLGTMGWRTGRETDEMESCRIVWDHCLTTN